MRALARFLFSHWVLCPLLALLLITGILVDSPSLLRFEYPLHDQLLRLRNSTLSSKVLLLSIDQQSRARYGEAIATRAGLVPILDKLSALGVRRLALLTPLSFSDDPESDRQLSEQLAQLRPILPLEPRQGDASGSHLPAASTLPVPAFETDPLVLLKHGANPLAGYRCPPLPAQDFLPPANRFAALQLPLGALQFSTDVDGRIRSTPLLIPIDGGLLPSLPLQLALTESGLKADQLSWPAPGQPGKVQIGQRSIPFDHDYQLRLDLSGAYPPYLQASVVQLLEGELDQRQLQDKLILLGQSPEFGANRLLANREPVGLAELATLTVASMLTDTPLERPVWGWQIEGLVLTIFLLQLLIIIPRLNTATGLISLGLMVGIWILVCAVSLIFYGTWLWGTPPPLLALSGFLLVRWNVGHNSSRSSSVDQQRQLALSHLEQGRLEQALDRFLRFKPKDDATREMLYNLALDLERKRMQNKARTAYRHLLTGGRYRDAQMRLKQLQTVDQPTPERPTSEGTLVLTGPGEKPTLGRYRIERELGQGAMGTVYLGTDPKINRQVAIKTLDYQQFDPDQLPSIKERFFREAEAAGRLSHPHIVTVYDVGEENDLAYLAMELLEGADLSVRCRPDRLFAPEKVLGILEQAAQALAYAHDKGVIHRDIKPSNILMLEDGRIKVADFGIARLATSDQTTTGTVLGTPSYMSPEQVAGKTVDGRSDLFSLGIVMYELLTGEKPFQGDSLAALMFAIANCQYPPLREKRPKLPEGYQVLLEKLLQKSASRRFKSAAILAKELSRLRQEQEIG